MSIIDLGLSEEEFRVICVKCGGITSVAFTKLQPDNDVHPRDLFLLRDWVMSREYILLVLRSFAISLVSFHCEITGSGTGRGVAASNSFAVDATYFDDNESTSRIVAWRRIITPQRAGLPL